MRKTLLKWMLVAGMLPTAAIAETDNPYGVCAHVSRGELNIAPQEFARMHEAGINWVRTDFDWSPIEQKPGQWNFTRLDQLVLLAKKNQINILPILNDVVPWATPPWKYPDAWGAFVHSMAAHFGKDLRCWEVWNEPNSSGCWRGPASGTQYAGFLQRAYEEMKKVDPNLTVVYGGVAEVPLDYIEDSLKAGAGKYFDVMNIHPYHLHGGPELLPAQITSLRELMAKYGVGNKPIWITETGVPSSPQRRVFRDVLPAVFKRLNLDPKQMTVAVVYDVASGFEGARNFFPDHSKTIFKNVAPVTLAQIKTLNVKDFPVLVPAATQEFPAQYIPALVGYVQRGGTLLLPYGLPFYFDHQLDGRGWITKKVQVNDRYMKDFHIGWDTWWTNPGTPKVEKRQYPAPGFETAFSVDFAPTSRFLHGRNLRPGDEFIPVIMGEAEDFKGAVAGVYKLNSNLKGNVIVFTKMAGCGSVTEAGQAELLPRTYLIAMASGVSRIFWYNFRAMEINPEETEHHFGIVHPNLTPKPAFLAYQALTRLCPSGSSTPRLQHRGQVYSVNWTRPDGVKVWSIWAADSPEAVTLGIKGKIIESFDHLGGKLPETVVHDMAKPGPIYLVGPENIVIETAKGPLQ